MKKIIFFEVLVFLLPVVFLKNKIIVDLLLGFVWVIPLVVFSLIYYRKKSSMLFKIIQWICLFVGIFYGLILLAFVSGDAFRIL